jgi:DNA-binding response OmpR family regulator
MTVTFSWMSSDRTILIVEDDEQLARLLLEYLSRHSYDLSWVQDGEAALGRINEQPPDLVILDLMLPGMSGLDVCQQVRPDYRGAILMLTASQSEADHINGLELGADDFVTKPLEPRVLLARIRTLLRRTSSAGHGAPGEGAPDTLRAGPLSLDAATRQAWLNGEPVELTGMEFDVLRLLVQEAGHVVTRDDLYERICGMPYDGLDRGMDVHVSRIRRKLQVLGCEPSLIKAVRSAGYILAVK